MSPLLSFVGALAVVASLSTGVLSDDGDGQTCYSYGMDFQTGATYFQNVNSQDPFTFVQEFEGCKNDTAKNVLVDPNGNQYLCTNTPLLPDDIPEMSTCPLNKNQLVSGAWSILIMSNNGKAPDAGQPIAYERDFYLTVGSQKTVTQTPTVTSTVVLPSIINTTTTSTSTVMTTLPPSTTTVPKATIQKTKTVTPDKVVVTTTVTLATITIPKYSLSVSKSVVTTTASCHLPKRQPKADPTCTITPTVATAKALATASATPSSAKFRRTEDTDTKLREDRTKWLKEREERLADAAANGLEKRAPDPQPLTVTDQVVSDWVTSTSTSYASPVTSTIIATATTTSTVTPTPITVVSGTTQLPAVTVTAATPTKTKTQYTIAKVTQTKFQTVSITVTTTTTPAAVKTACRKAGGILYR